MDVYFDFLCNPLGIIIVLFCIGFYGLWAWNIISSNSRLPLRQTSNVRLSITLVIIIVLTPMLMVYCRSCSFVCNFYDGVIEEVVPEKFFEYIVYGIARLESLIPSIEILKTFYDEHIILATLLKLLLIIGYNLIIVLVMKLKKLFDEDDLAAYRAAERKDKERPKEYAWFRDKKNGGYVFAEVDNKDITFSTNFIRIVGYYICFGLFPLVSCIMFISEFIIRISIFNIKIKNKTTK